MSSRTGLSVLVLTLGLGFAGVASAQEGQPPPGEPEAPPPTEEPDKDKQPAPTPPPATTQQPTTAQPPKTGTSPSATGAPAAGGGFTASTTAAPPTPDKPTAKDESLPPRVPWRGTRLEWTSSATTTALGVGRDNIGDDAESAGMLWTLWLQYYLVDLDFWSFRLVTTPPLTVDLPNADDTTTEREPQFLDLPVLGTFSLNAVKKGLWTTTPSFTSGLIFPTWKYTYSNGTYITTSNRVSLAQGIPLGGENAPAFKSFTLTGGFRWDHRFSRATTGTNSNVSDTVPRQDNDTTRPFVPGAADQDPQLSGSRLSRETLRERLTVGFAEAFGGVGLNLDFDFLFAQAFLPDFPEGDPNSPDGNCIILSTGPVCPTHEDDKSTRHYYGFGVSFEVVPVPEMSVALGYTSSNSPLGQEQLAPDGTNQDFFYSPSAEFSVMLTFNPDALYERLTGPKRAVADNNKKKPTKRVADKKTTKKTAARETR